MRKMMKIGRRTATEGIILVESIHIRMSLVRLVGANAMAQAEGMAMISARMVEPTERITEFMNGLK
ncbi:hypothetical protein D3C87_1937710 [compost metagenome]